MNYIIFYILVIAASFAQSNSCSTEQNGCTFILNCENYIDQNLQWSTFSSMYSTRISCENPISYAGYGIYPVKLIFKMNGNDPTTEVPQSSSEPYRSSRRHWGDQQTDGHIHDIVQSLDLSHNEYTETPTIRSMMNLMKLDLSNNHLTTAKLSNLNELYALTQLNLSYNRISDIQIDQNPYKKLVDVDISNNYLVKIPDAIFDKFDYLQILDLSHNYIDTLSQLTFEGIKKIKKLNLSNNRLTDINNSLFRFNDLNILNLSGNRIKDLNMNDFEQLHNLETLDLSSNMIKTIKFNVFAAMTLLETLDLSNNQLEIVKQNTFFTLQSLHTINLSKNKLKILPKGLFQNTTIHAFDITENKFEGSLEKGMFDGVNVTKLDLSHQHFTAIADYAFYDLNNLYTLLLNSNDIQTLSNMCFETLTSLQHLDLSDNQVTNIDFDKEDLSNLKSLVLKKNRLTEIKHQDLQHLINLEYLDLSDNQISRLEPRSFHSLTNLINLEINNNPLIGTLETGTFDGLILLPSLDVSHNMLSTIQNASFKDMAKLTLLNVSSCDISELQYNTFINTGYIETLDLSYNKLKEFYVNTTELVGLTTLLLNNNLIKTITSATFIRLSQLNKIIISHNKIDDINNTSFNNLVDLRHLDLSYNENLNFNVTMLDNNKNLNTLSLSGIKTSKNFENIVKDSSVTDVKISNATVGNVSELHLNSLDRLDTLDLSYNNISQLVIGDFTGISNLRFLDLSFNKISFIQPGAFKDNTVLYSLNISHNCLTSVSYGIFRGLIYLSLLDMSYNKIKDLESERFYEVKSLSQLIVDFNRIDSVNAEEFIGTSLSKLSIGDNPLPCQILVKLRKNGVPFDITAIKLDEHSNENVNGVGCNKDSTTEPTVTRTLVTEKDNSGLLNGLRNILNNFTNNHSEIKINDTHYLENITNVLEKSNSLYDDRFSYMANLTNKGIAVLHKLNNDTNVMLNKIIELLRPTNVLISTSTPASLTEAVTATTTSKPVLKNNLNQSLDIVTYINQIKNELESAMSIQKQNILNEIDRKLALNNYQTETISKSISQEKLVTNNEGVKSVFTETCVALILLILVGIVLYKFYKSRMFVRNRFSLSTRELPGAMENSAL